MQCTILMCPSQDTKEILKLAEEDYPGLFWTPIFTRMRRLPRSRKKVVTYSAALPGYIFMKGDYVVPPTLSRKGVRVLPRADGYPARCHIDEIKAFHRTLSHRSDDVQIASPKLDHVPVVPSFPVGSTVEVIGEGHMLQGITGVVISCVCDEITIETKDFWGKLKINAFLLRQL